MSRVLLIEPWCYRDEGVKRHASLAEWRNGPYSLVLLGTVLRENGHDVEVVDLERILVSVEGDVDSCLLSLEARLRMHHWDIVGIGFFSIHVPEVRKIVERVRRVCTLLGEKPILIGGGIHASTEPEHTATDLGFDCAFVGEAELGLVELANSGVLSSVEGIYLPGARSVSRGRPVAVLDSLPFPDWSLVDAPFYAAASLARSKLWPSRSLDVLYSRGCSGRCNFCAYGAISKLRFHSARYVVEQVKQLARTYPIDCIYFADSSIGISRAKLEELLDEMMRQRVGRFVEWHANMRSDQVDKELLRRMQKAGCSYLFYGFESGSERILERMNKGTTVQQARIVAEWHKELRFPYHASMIMNYPGETEQDVRASIELIRQAAPPSVGINFFVPLPGSRDYSLMKEMGRVACGSVEEWRSVGEATFHALYADMPADMFSRLAEEFKQLAYVELPARVTPREWGRDLSVALERRLRGLRRMLGRRWGRR